MPKDRMCAIGSLADKLLSAPADLRSPYACERSGVTLSLSIARPEQ